MDKEEKEYMKDVIEEYLTECENDDFDCTNCPDISECYYKAQDICNDEFAESISYGGYDTAEEFWENLLD